MVFTHPWLQSVLFNEKIINAIYYINLCNKLTFNPGPRGQKCETVTLLFIYSKALFE